MLIFYQNLELIRPKNRTKAFSLSLKRSWIVKKYRHRKKALNMFFIILYNKGHFVGLIWSICCSNLDLFDYIYKGFSFIRGGQRNHLYLKYSVEDILVRDGSDSVSQNERVVLCWPKPDFGTKTFDTKADYLE